MTFAEPVAAPDGLACPTDKGVDQHGSELTTNGLDTETGSQHGRAFGKNLLLKTQIPPPLFQFLPVDPAVLERLATERETRNPPEDRDCG